MSKTALHLAAVFLSILFIVSLSAQEKESKPEKKEKPKEVALTGRVVDSECYMKMGDMGLSEDHHNCAEACAKGGIALAFLEEKSNDLYNLANEGMSMKSANDKLMSFIDEKVSIKGKLVERSGARLLVISSVEKSK